MSKKPKIKKSKVKTARRSAVDYDEFVKLWKVSGSVGEVARKLGIKANSASTIAMRLRAGGVKLRRFPRRAAQTIDAKKLNRIVEAR